MNGVEGILAFPQEILDLFQFDVVDDDCVLGFEEADRSLGQGAVNMLYDGMNATVLYSKIADSVLPSEIEGEQGNILVDRIQTPTDVRFYARTAPASGRGARPEPEQLSVASEHDEYYYEIAEFIDLVQAGEVSSRVNSHAASLTVMQIVDEVRRQIGVRYPADESPMSEM